MTCDPISLARWLGPGKLGDRLVKVDVPRLRQQSPVPAAQGTLKLGLELIVQLSVRSPRARPHPPIALLSEREESSGLLDPTVAEFRCCP